MNDIDKTARLARYRTDAGMAGYESDMDQRKLVSPRHAMRMDGLPLSARIRHMTVGEIAKLAVTVAVRLAALLALLFSIGMVTWIAQDICRYGLFG